ncbi:hypothetical protein [Paenibacillus elgii]|uniref:hypothetical protein n=1 Tax=Paenibacillus elgii TaxID=189691 RepID=UPI00203D7102|nr:hypothetical protein [Paenibacillus elgii]MCM3274147.1 hypothetical protein [Paenibacillus elgii]
MPRLGEGADQRRNQAAHTGLQSVEDEAEKERMTEEDAGRAGNALLRNCGKI